MRQIPLRLPAFAVLLSLLAAGAAAGPGRVPPPADQPELVKLSGHLLRVRELALADRSAAEIAAAVPAARLAGDLAAVQVSLERLTPAILERLRGAGLAIDSFDFEHALAYGRVDPAGLGKIAAVAEVSTIHPMPRRGTRVGSTTSQADASMNADEVRTALPGIDGSGVDVGILSDSFNKTTLGGTVSGGACTCATPGSTCTTVVSGMTNQSSGDLPPSIPILDDCTAGSPNCDFLSDEGAGIGELIFDVAPGAGFLFHSAFNSPSDFAGGITELVNCGADLIVDDVFYTLQPFFQDGVIAQAAQAAFDAGVPYFSAAGNDATFGVHDAYTDSNPGVDDEDGTPSGDDLHDFDPGPGVDSFAAITLPKDCSITAELQWSEPFDGTLGPGASSDLDLFILSSAADPASAANILASSITFTGCGATPVGECADGVCGDPVESVTYLNETGATDTVFLAIEHFCGDEDIDLRVVNISFNCNFLAAPWNFEDGGGGETPIFVDAQIFGHPAAKDVVAVAAAFYGEIDSGGMLDDPPTQLDVEPFSSRGGDLPFYFDGDGDPLPGALAGSGAAASGPVTRDGPPPPETRFKPEITSVDGTNTTFFGCPDPGGDPCVEGDGFPNFFGTSASAPNATALAVLIWQITGELISPAALNQLIFQAVEDMELPGQDDLSGFGFADALDSASALDGSLSPLIDDLEFDLDGGAFFTSPPTGGTQRLQAKKKLILADGDFTGIDGLADEIIFADGFESGDTSSWTSSTP